MFRFFMFALLLTNFSFASPVPVEHQSHCEKWENGFCTKGALGKLANNSFFASIKTQTNTCDKVCKEGCPNCQHCGLCGLCAIYNDQACVDVPYFTDRKSCNIAKTKNCCDLCEVQCKSPQGVCSAKGFCRGGTAETDLMTFCVEKTTEDECKTCKKG